MPWPAPAAHVPQVAHNTVHNSDVVKGPSINLTPARAVCAESGQSFRTVSRLAIVLQAKGGSAHPVRCVHFLTNALRAGCVGEPPQWRTVQKEARATVVATCAPLTSGCLWRSFRHPPLSAHRMNPMPQQTHLRVRVGLLMPIRRPRRMHHPETSA